MGDVKNFVELKKQLIDYPYGSFKDYTKKSLPTRKIIGSGVFDAYRAQSTEKMLRDAVAYHQEYFAKPSNMRNKPV